MRVALLAPLFESVPPRLYGGTERVVHQLYRGLLQNQIDVTLFASGDSSVEGKKVAVLDEALRLKQPPVQDSIPYHLKMLSIVADRAKEFDIIHNHHDYWMLPLLRMTDVPIVHTLHGRLDSLDLEEVFRGYPEANYVSISHSQRHAVRHLSLIRWVANVYNSIDVNSYVFREKPGKYLAFLGRISPEKRPEWAIEIAHQSGVPLIIAAKIDGRPGQDYYDHYVKSHVDGKFIQYIGEISEKEKSDFLGNALALTFPIDWPEPFGLVMVESLACGTPVLARPCGSVNEILKNEVTGFCDLDIRELARKVKDLPVIDRKQCRRWAEEKFSLTRMTEDYVDVYRRLERTHYHRRNLLHSVECTSDGDTKDQF